MIFVYHEGNLGPIVYVICLVLVCVCCKLCLDFEHVHLIFIGWSPWLASFYMSSNFVITWFAVSSYVVSTSLVGFFGGFQQRESSSLMMFDFWVTMNGF